MNRVGLEMEPQGSDGIDFWGQSFLADPYGELVAEASATHEQVLVAPADLSKMAEIRAGWSFPFRDRRVDSYSGITELYLDT